MRRDVGGQDTRPDTAGSRTGTEVGRVGGRERSDLQMGLESVVTDVERVAGASLVHWTARARGRTLPGAPRAEWIGVAGGIVSYVCRPDEDLGRQIAQHE